MGGRNIEMLEKVASYTDPVGDLACNPGMSPDQESNWWPPGLQVGIQSPESHQSIFLRIYLLV